MLTLSFRLTALRRAYTLGQRMIGALAGRRFRVTVSRETFRFSCAVSRVTAASEIFPAPELPDVSRETNPPVISPAGRNLAEMSTVPVANLPELYYNREQRTAPAYAPSKSAEEAVLPLRSGGVTVAKRIVVANQKGGVGKTTTAVNLAAALQQQGKRVLLCDFDPQANATSGFGVDKNAASPNIYDVLIDGADVRRAIVSTQWGDVIPSNKALAGAGIEMTGLERREMLLKDALEPLGENYDYIFIDCPPSLELLTLNGLCAADSVLVPVQCEYYALEGLSDLLSTIRIVKRKLNRKIELEGVLLTMFDGRTNLSLQVAEEVKRHFPGQVYATVIPRNVRLSEAPSHGMPVMAYDKYSTGAQAYLRLAEEFIAE